MGALITGPFFISKRTHTLMGDIVMLFIIKRFKTLKIVIIYIWN